MKAVSSCIRMLKLPNKYMWTKYGKNWIKREKPNKTEPKWLFIEVAIADLSEKIAFWKREVADKLTGTLARNVSEITHTGSEPLQSVCWPKQCMFVLAILRQFTVLMYFLSLLDIISARIFQNTILLNAQRPYASEKWFLQCTLNQNWSAIRCTGCFWLCSDKTFVNVWW